MKSLNTTNYLYDGANLVEEVDSSGNALARYTQGPEVDQSLAQSRSGTTSYYQRDGINAVSSLSNAAGALANTFTYDSFGKLTASTGTLINPFQYAGREFDSETGLYFYRARYLDPSTGRFLSEDPLTLRSAVNHYPYVGNSPIAFYDPWGLMSWEYNVTRRNHGWGPFQNGEFRPDLPPDIRVDCQCECNKGPCKAKVTVTFTILIWYGTQGQLQHENGHLEILQNYLNGRTQHYANTYERTYPNKEECEKARTAIERDLLSDWQQIKKLEDAHEDWLQNAIQWIYNLF